MISPDIVTRTIAGLALSVAIAAIARSREALTTGGSIAAVFVATATAAAGWTWAAALIAFFLASTLLSRAGGRSKRERTEDIVAKAGARDAWQVIANGGPFAAIAVASILWPSADWTIPGAGAVAASNADTWATEIGTMSRRAPRSIITFREMAPGTSGSVTWAGMLGSLAGAVFIALILSLGGWPVQSACAALIGGVSGSLLDSIIGATIQEKRWCASCGRGTERAVHTCGSSTTVIGGVSWIRNDAVNFISSVAGALIGMLCLL